MYISDPLLFHGVLQSSLGSQPLPPGNAHTCTLCAAASTRCCRSPWGTRLLFRPQCRCPGLQEDFPHQARQLLGCQGPPPHHIPARCVCEQSRVLGYTGAQLVLTGRRPECAVGETKAQRRRPSQGHRSDEATAGGRPARPQSWAFPPYRATLCGGLCVHRLHH